MGVSICFHSESGIDLPLRIRLDRAAHVRLRSRRRLGLGLFGRGHDPAGQPRAEGGEPDEDVATCAHEVHFITAADDLRPPRFHPRIE